MSSQAYSDVVVAGGGPVGLLSALALSRRGPDTVLFAPDFDAPAADARTTALMQGSIGFLSELGVWGELKGFAEPLDVMALTDRTTHAVRARDVSFRADELGPEPFGWNIPNIALVTVLRRNVETSGTRIVRAPVRDVVLEDDGHAVRVEDAYGSRYRSAVLLAADGRNSLCRRRAGIRTNDWSYPQHAVVCCFDHSRPHKRVSTEFHHDAGPMTVVPLPGKRSSLVWVETPEEAERLVSLDDETFAAELEERTGGLLGRISGVTERHRFPITGLTARSFASNRTILLGEAAHVIPPIGAQGLNLGVRDVSLAADLVAEAFDAGRDPGGKDLLDTFDRRRRRDVVPRTVAVDVLNRSLIHRFGPLQGLRSLGISVLDKVTPVRRFMMQQGIGPRDRA